MKDQSKTEADLKIELEKARRRIVKLETSLAEYQQTGADLEMQAAVEKEGQPLAEIFHQTSTVLNSTLDYDKVLDYILAQAGQVVSHDAACLMLVEAETARVFRWYGYAQDGFDPFFSVSGFKIADTPFLRTVRETGQPFVIPTIEAGDPPLYGFNRPLFKSHLTVPIQTGDELLGFLNLDSMIANHFSQTEANRLQTLANQAANALKNSRLYQQARQEILTRVKALKKERNFVSTVLDTAGALVMVLNPRGRILRFNRACEQTTGYSIEEVRGKLFWDLFLPPVELEMVKSSFNLLREGELTNEYECHWLTKDGQKRLIVWSNSVIFDHKDSVEYIISSGIDITEHRQLEDQLLAIHRLGQRLNLLRNEADILEIALKTAASLLQFESAGYGLLQETDGSLVYGYQLDCDLPTKHELRLPLNRKERIKILQAYRQDMPKSDTASSKLKSDSAELSTSFWLTAPIKIGDFIIGVLDVERHEPHHFTSNDQQLLQTLADQTAVALENARLHKESRQQVAELATMNVVGQAVTSTLNLEETLKIITDHAIRLLGATAASVVLHDEVRDNLWFNTASGGESDFVQGKRLAAGQGIVGWVIQNGKPALVPDVSQDNRFFSEFDQQTGFTTQSVLCVPLQTRNRTIGAVEVMNKKNNTFTSGDLRLLSWLASPATIAIENARLFEQIHIARKEQQFLSRRLVEVQEAERRHIARELHDEAGQALTLLMFGLGMLEKEAHDPSAVTTRTAKLKNITNEVSKNLHRLAVDLRPASLDHLGLVAALRQYIEKFGHQHSLTVQFEAVGIDDQRLPLTVETNLYRIIQEALTNIARHARATRVDLLLERRGTRIFTIIEDDGVGFDPETAGQHNRLGLLGMRERTEMMGGNLVIESIPGTGTTIYVEVSYVDSDLDC